MGEISNSGCKLCGKTSELVESHIIPKFVFKWMKQTGTPYLRSGKTPNVRAQDGIKEFLFCRECEQLLGTSEKWFSENIFVPYLEEGKIVFLYQELLSKFIFSLLWRLLLVTINDTDFDKQAFKNEISAAFAEWKAFLLYNTNPSTYNEAHLCFIPDEWGADQPNEYVSRYFSRTVDGHIITINDECWVYVKFARFMFFGKIKSSVATFRNSKIDLFSGSTLPAQFIDNPAITTYLMSRAHAVYMHFKTQMSPQQLGKIDEYSSQNIEKILLSDLGKRIKQDYSAVINPNGAESSFNYLCDCCTKQLSEPNGYMLRTFEIVLSKEYFKKQFQALQLDISEEHLKIRLEYFKKIVSQSGPWVVCDDCSKQFEFNKKKSKRYLQNWINKKGKYCPPKSADFRKHLTEAQIAQISFAIVTV